MQHRVLLIEDDEDVTSRIRRTNDELYGNASPIKFDLIVRKTKLDALQTIKSERIDCAIVDLRLPSDATDRTDNTAETGNSVVEEILRMLAIPIAIHSGHPTELDEKFGKVPIERFTKEAGAIEKIFQWLASLTELMSASASSQNAIRQEAAQLFHLSIWPRWKERHGSGTIPPDYTEAVTRQMVAHLVEKLQMIGGGASYLSDEFYFHPPIRERLHTGDLADLDKKVYVLLTPQCDIVRAYPAHLLLVECVPVTDWQKIETLFHQAKTSKTKQEDLSKALGRLTNYNAGPGVHFIPPLGEKGPWEISFKSIITVESSKVPEILSSRFASISPQFLPNLTTRFAAYLGRYGQPNLDEEELKRTIESRLQTKTGP